MEGNKEEALRCLAIAQKHRTARNLPSALKFAQKSVTLFSTPEGNAMVSIIEREITITPASTPGTAENGNVNGSAGGSGSGSVNGESSKARSTGVEEHLTSASQRPGHEKSKKRDYTPKQMEVVKRVKTCKHHQYYEILAGMLFNSRDMT